MELIEALRPQTDVRIPKLVLFSNIGFPEAATQVS